MPIIISKKYNPPLIFKNHYCSTIFPSLFRKISVNYSRKRYHTPDGDFLDLDWSKRGNSKLLIAIHGLEGSSESNYIKGIVNIFNDNNYDGVAINLRGCSGEHNLGRENYHSGQTSDLDFVVKTILKQDNYEEIIIVGFSLGGNIVLKYGGEKGTQIPKQIKKIIGVSVPTDLTGSVGVINRKRNFIYLRRFLVSLKEKYKAKQHLYPDLDNAKILGAKDFTDFDGAFTAPVHGFESAEDYWHKSSSIFFLDNIKIPALILSALDDSFLSEKSYPYAHAERNPNLFLITPKNGGHVGFPQFKSNGYYWSEERIMEFVLADISN